MINLDPRHLHTVIEILAKYAPECEVRVFGSRVTGNVKSYSDLNIALVGRETLGFEKMGAIREAFEESHLPIRVDILDWHNISCSFRKVIEERYETLNIPSPRRQPWNVSEIHVRSSTTRVLML